ncbi:MAG: hypothetical protein KOO66_12350 [Bacteroidales bacterium]|nr:hypothetical protein [Bacteroidales bacterium]
MFHFRKRIIVSLIILYIIVEGLAFLVIERSHDREMNQTLNKYTDELEVKYKAAQSAYVLLTENIIRPYINKPEVMQLFSKANHADSLQKIEIRDSLYSILLPVYKYLEASNVEHFHFHLPNNESFLRFHRPEKYGDDLSDIRYSVKMANLTKQDYKGLEEGRTLMEFSYVFPLFYENEHIGSGETCFSFDAIKTQLKVHGNEVFDFMIKKDTVNTIVFEDEKSSYMQSLISDDYFHEEKRLNYKDDTLNIINQINKSLKGKIEKKLANNKNFTTYLKINKDYYLISFVSVNNIEGKHAAYVISYQRDNKIAQHKTRHYHTHSSSFIGFFAIGLFVLLIVKKNEKIKESEEGKKTKKEILDTFKDGIYISTPDYRISYVNSALQEKLGCDPIGEYCYKALFNYEKKCSWCAYEKLKKEKNKNSYELNTENGKTLVVSNTLIENNNKITVFHDITNRKKMEQALTESIQTKNKFFSIIAHDLKNPFNTLLGFSDLLLKNYKVYDEEKCGHIVKIINDSTKNTYSLLENLLTWSRSQSGKIKFSPEEIKIKTIINEVILLLQQSAKNKNIRLSDNSEANLTVYSDKNMLNTILRNLVSNAIKFTHQNGAIIISACETKNQDFIEITVADTGVGISKEKTADLFRIEKSDATYDTDNERGTGLGLILCKEFVEKNGGRIWVESELNKGSKFVFTTPTIMR